LIDNSEINGFLGERGARLWLQFKIFEAMEILRNIKGSPENKKKRRRVAEVIASHNCAGSNLEDLLRECCSAIGHA
jgi:hypothetical protein